MKIKSSLILLLVLNLMACNKEYKAGKKLVGDWNIRQLERSYYTDGVLDSVRTLNNVAKVTFSQEKEVGIMSNRVKYTVNPSLFQPYFIEYDCERWLQNKDLDERIIFNYGYISGGIAYTTLKFTKSELVLQVLLIDFNGEFSTKEVVTFMKI
jgi:hypothetical protein